MRPRVDSQGNRKKKRISAVPLAAVKDTTPEVHAKAVGFGQHLLFFDADEDRKISLFETMQGLERLGFGHLLSVPGALAINAGVMALALAQGKVLNPNRLELRAVSFVRHDDTQFVSEAGHFDEAALREAFAAFGHTFAGEALTMRELADMAMSRVISSASESFLKQLGLPLGLAAVLVEWGALLWLAGTHRDGMLVLEREAVRRFYTDAQFFQELETRLSEDRARRARTLPGKARNFVQSWLI
jgi:hypothetical protein